MDYFPIACRSSALREDVSNQDSIRNLHAAWSNDARQGLSAESCFRSASVPFPFVQLCRERYSGDDFCRSASPMPFPHSGVWSGSEHRLSTRGTNESHTPSTFSFFSGNLIEDKLLQAQLPDSPSDFWSSISCESRAVHGLLSVDTSAGARLPSLASGLHQTQVTLEASLLSGLAYSL